MRMMRWKHLFLRDEANTNPIVRRFYMPLFHFRKTLVLGNMPQMAQNKMPPKRDLHVTLSSVLRPKNKELSQVTANGSQAYLYGVGSKVTLRGFPE